MRLPLTSLRWVSQLEPNIRQDVRMAASQGQPVTNPDNAALALRYADGFWQFWKELMVIGLLSGVIGAIFLFTVPVFPPIFGKVWIGWSIVQTVASLAITPGLFKRLKRGKEANRVIAS